MIRVAICDDHEIVRAGIVARLPADMSCVLSSSSLDDFLARYKDAAPQVSVIDLSLSNVLGASVITQIREKFTDARIVIYSVRDSLGAIGACYAVGVGAFVSKADDVVHLIEAVRRVNDDGKYFPPGLAERLALHELCNTEKNPRHVLNEDELELFTQVARGEAQKDIAAKLGVAPKTVRNKTYLIRDKLREPTRNWLDIALRYNLVSDIR